MKFQKFLVGLCLLGTSAATASPYTCLTDLLSALRHPFQTASALTGYSTAAFYQYRMRWEIRRARWAAPNQEVAGRHWNRALEHGQSLVAALPPQNLSLTLNDYLPLLDLVIVAADQGHRPPDEALIFFSDLLSVILWEEPYQILFQSPTTPALEALLSARATTPDQFRLNQRQLALGFPALATNAFRRLKRKLIAERDHSQDLSYPRYQACADRSGFIPRLENLRDGTAYPAVNAELNELSAFLSEAPTVEIPIPK